MSGENLMIAPALISEMLYNCLEDGAPAVLEGWLTGLRLSKQDVKAFQ
ncbi:MAG: hypothetical protein IVW51_12685 [Thermaceae bacterium]|nr:hypothetical protein [Thermaceae bacterium]